MNVIAKRPLLSGLAVAAVISLCAGCGLQNAPASSTDALQMDVSTDLIPDTDPSTGDTPAESASEDATNSDTTGGTAALKASTFATNNQSTSAGALPSTLTATELQLLQSVLGGLGTGSTTSSTSNTSSGTPSLSDLTHLGFSRRDMAVWVLDFLAQQSNLTTEQSFAIGLARAFVTRDTSALEQLLIQQLLPAITGGSSTSTTQAVTQ